MTELRNAQKYTTISLFLSLPLFVSSSLLNYNCNICFRRESWPLRLSLSDRNFSDIEQKWIFPSLLNKPPFKFYSVSELVLKLIFRWAIKLKVSLFFIRQLKKIIWLCLNCISFPFRCFLCDLLHDPAPLLNFHNSNHLVAGLIWTGKSMNSLNLGFAAVIPKHTYPRLLFKFTMVQISFPS